MSEQDMVFNGSEAAANFMDDAKASSAEVSGEVKSAAQNVREAISRNAADVAGKVNVKLKEAGMDAEPLVKAARDRTSDLGTALIEEVKRRPLQAVMVAALAGLVVGVLSSR